MAMWGTGRNKRPGLDNPAGLYTLIHLSQSVISMLDRDKDQRNSKRLSAETRQLELMVQAAKGRHTGVFQFEQKRAWKKTVPCHLWTLQKEQAEKNLNGEGYVYD